MRRASGLRVSSPRDMCAFCATRPVHAVDTSIRLSIVSQRRHLQSSGKAPQYASEQQMYKEQTPPPRPMTVAERARQQLMAGLHSAVHQPSTQGGYMSPAERAKQTLQSSASSRSPPQSNQYSASERRPSVRRTAFEGPARNNNRDRPAPTRIPANRFTHESRQVRHTVNMNSRPHMDTPAFGVGQLRRRNEPQSNYMQNSRESTRSAPVPRQPLARKLDSDEISKLLNDNSRNPTNQYTRLTRETNATVKCWHCGQDNHMSYDCPDKPLLKSTPARSSQQAPESVSEAAEAWVRKAGDGARAEQTSAQFSYEKETRGRDVQRRSRRFEIPEPVETRNRYEEPERRRRGGEQRSRRIVRQEEEEDERHVDKAERKRQRKEAKKAAQIAQETPTPIRLPEYISVANLASMLKVKVDDFVVKLEELGFEDVQNDHILNAEHAGLVAQEYNFEPVVQSEDQDADLFPAPALPPDEYAQLPVRPPVVTIMGHVDHGKTTILDYIRSTAVAATEFGGITQHIGAFSVPLASGKKITFLDTPGHSAFETMRARGANVTDIVVLVVAADDSVMPQTVEAIKHAQAARVPIIVAINKIDKAQADADAVKSDLGRYGIEVEDFGGDVQTICVSGKTGQGIPDLEEAISTLSEILDHRADPNASVEGWVLEGATKKSGRTATVLVRRGTLRQGDTLVAGNTWTRVRTLKNEAGVVVDEVGPGMPVEVDGWREQPIAGDEVLQAADEQQAASVTEFRLGKVERVQLAKDMEAINEFRRQESIRREAEEAAEEAAAKGEAAADGEAVAVEAKEKGSEIVTFIVKGDVSGSVEAVVDSVSAIGNAEVSARILRHGVGSPSEFDVQHAADASGHIINFNTIVPPHIKSMAEDKGVKILDSNIIYRVVEDVKTLLSEKLPPNIIQRVTGEAEIAIIFEIGLGGRKKMKVAGSKVRNGSIEKGSKAKVLRGETVVYDGLVSSLKNHKKDVEQMRKDTECGIAFDGWEDFKSGDKVQCYDEKHEKRSL